MKIKGFGPRASRLERQRTDVHRPAWLKDLGQWAAQLTMIVSDPHRP